MSRDILYENLIRPLLFGLDPEEVHDFAHRSLLTAAPLLQAFPFQYKKDDLKVELFGKKLSNPVGLAAGFDKNGSLTPVLGALGFGFMEVGSVCARPHGGNPRPRLFRLRDDQALINRLGLNGIGAQFISTSLAQKKFSLPCAINIAKTNDPQISGDAAVEDVVYSFSLIKDLPIEFVTINASCPNTAEGCVKESGVLKSTLERVQDLNAGKLPVLVKLSPDSSDDFLSEIASISKSLQIAGYVCGNTTTSREQLETPRERLETIGAGGLSGKPLRSANLALTRKMAKLKSAEQVIIGVGGIGSGQDCLDYLDAGARVVELYTSFVYRGPSCVKQICEELSELLKQRGITLSELVKSMDSGGR